MGQVRRIIGSKGRKVKLQKAEQSKGRTVKRYNYKGRMFKKQKFPFITNQENFPANLNSNPKEGQHIKFKRPQCSDPKPILATALGQKTGANLRDSYAPVGSSHFQIGCVFVDWYNFTQMSNT